MGNLYFQNEGKSQGMSENSEKMRLRNCRSYPTAPLQRKKVIETVIKWT